MAERVFAPAAFNYDSDIHLEDGEIFALRGYANDVKMVRADLVRAIEAPDLARQCDRCGKEFVDDHFLAAHRLAAHAPSEDREAAAKRSPKRGKP